MVYSWSLSAKALARVRLALPQSHHPTCVARSLPMAAFKLELERNYAADDVSRDEGVDEAGMTA